MLRAGTEAESRHERFVARLREKELTLRVQAMALRRGDCGERT